MFQNKLATVIGPTHPGTGLIAATLFSTLIKTAYWNKGKELGKLNGCEKGKYLTKGNL